MSRQKRAILLVLCILLVPSSGFGLRIAVVQLAVEEATFASVESFRRAMTSAVEESIAESRPDLVIFPEYTAVFLALLPWASEVRGASSVAEAFSRVREADPRITSMQQVFLQQAQSVQRTMTEVFGGLARRHGVAIVAGSAFVGAPAAGGKTELRNRAFVFGRDGRILHIQDKVFLTDFETDVVGLSPGLLSDALPFAVAGARIGLTLCRDTFSREWEQQMREVDLWVDIKANGAAFTAEERESFQRALPARLPGAGVRWGVTACLVGGFLDLLWEGESCVIECVDGTVRVIAAAVSPRAPQLLQAQAGREKGNASSGALEGGGK